MFKKFAFLSVLLFNQNVGAAAFLFELPLLTNTSKEVTAYDIQLPQVVYEKAISPMMHDVRVKNSRGDDVPMRLALSRDDIKHNISATTLPIFSLNHTLNTPLRSELVSSNWQGGQTQYTVETSESIKNYIQSQEVVLHDRFLLDASLLNQASLNQTSLAAFMLSWQFDTPGNRVFYLEVKGSDDLANWNMLKSRHKLIELNTGQRVVLENKIAMNERTYAYYQLRFLDAPVPEISEVKAILTSHATKQPLIERKISDFENLNPNSVGHGISWDTGGNFPVESLKFEFDYKNLMADVQLYSRASSDSPWQHVSNSQLYQLGNDDMMMENHEIKIQPNHHRYWKLTTQSGISSQWINDVIVSWRPHQLQFLAQGKGPYSLFVGSAELNKAPSNRWYQQLSNQFRQELFSDEIEIGAIKILTPETEVIETQPETSLSRWIFWGLLIVVLSVLLYMASRLLKEVSSEH